MSDASAFERIQKVSVTLGYNSVNSFAKAIGYGRSSVFYHLKNGNTKKISNDIINRILTKHPDINRAYLNGVSDRIFSDPQKLKQPVNETAKMTEYEERKLLQEQIRDKQQIIDLMAKISKLESDKKLLESRIEGLELTLSGTKQGKSQRTA